MFIPHSRVVLKISKKCLFLTPPTRSLCWRNWGMVSHPKDIMSSVKVAFFIFTKRCNARKMYDFKILFLNVGSSFNELFLRIFFSSWGYSASPCIFSLLFFTIFLTRFWLTRYIYLIGYLAAKKLLSSLRKFKPPRFSQLYLLVIL